MFEFIKYCMYIKLCHFSPLTNFLVNWMVSSVVVDVVDVVVWLSQTMLQLILKLLLKNHFMYEITVFFCLIHAYSKRANFFAKTHVRRVKYWLLSTQEFDCIL